VNWQVLIQNTPKRLGWPVLAVRPSTQHRFDRWTHNLGGSAYRKYARWCDGCWQTGEFKVIYTYLRMRRCCGLQWFACRWSTEVGGFPSSTCCAIFSNVFHLGHLLDACCNEPQHCCRRGYLRVVVMRAQGPPADAPLHSPISCHATKLRWHYHGKRNSWFWARAVATTQASSSHSLGWNIVFPWAVQAASGGNVLLVAWLFRRQFEDD